MQTLSIIVPVWNEQETVPVFLETMNKVHTESLADYAFEYWFIDDGSKDDTLKVLREEQAKNPAEVHYLSFSRNFGKEAGLYAGLEQATGEYVVVMDVDVQDPPELLYNRFSKGMFSWIGFKQKYLEFENRDRVAGQTSWSFWSLFKYSIEGIVAFSQVPLAFVSFLGVLSFVTAIIGALVIVIRALLVANSSVAGWPSLVIIILFMGGIQLLSLGIVCRYISSIYLEVKNRPIYIAREKK